ncbi:hypothetical protein R6Q57_018721 [Mikania cordata]
MSGSYKSSLVTEVARQLYINDPSNKTSAAFTYEHAWNVVKEHEQKLAARGRIRALLLMPTLVTTTRPFGRDKAKTEAKAKAKLKGKAGIEPSEYDLRKLKLIDEMSSTNRAKSEAIENF